MLFNTALKTMLMENDGKFYNDTFLSISVLSVNINFIISIDSVASHYRIHSMVNNILLVLKNMIFAILFGNVHDTYRPEDSSLPCA